MEKGALHNHFLQSQRFAPLKNTQKMMHKHADKYTGYVPPMTNGRWWPTSSHKSLSWDWISLQRGSVNEEQRRAQPLSLDGSPLRVETLNKNTIFYSTCFLSKWVSFKFFNTDDMFTYTIYYCILHMSHIYVLCICIYLFFFFLFIYRITYPCKSLLRLDCWKIWQRRGTKLRRFLPETELGTTKHDSHDSHR